MKKILFLLILIYNYSSAYIVLPFGSTGTCPSGYSNNSIYSATSRFTSYSTCMSHSYKGIYNRHCSVEEDLYFVEYYYPKYVSCATVEDYKDPKNKSFNKDNHVCGRTGSGDFDCVEILDNGYVDDNLNQQCNAGYSKTGVANGIPACMPNPENGTWDDNDDLVCNHNYHKNEDGSGCVIDDGWNDIPIDVDTGTSGGDGGIGGTGDTGSGSTGSTDSGSGTGGTSGGSTGGGSGTSGSNSGNTTNENNTTPPTDTPIDNTPVANSCNDSNLTLQEKMLCELNAGMKKQNSENAPENSLNQLLKDLKNSNQTDNTALNTNIKATNTSLDSIKTFSQNQLNKQTEANTTLGKINDSANATELYNKVMTEDLNKLVNNTQDEEGKSYLGTITDFVKSLTTPTTDEDKNSYSNQINSKVTNTLSSTFSKYSNVLGFGSSYASAPDNITLTLFEHEYILIDFSILNSYVDVIRSLFLTLAYLYGFMNLLRSSR